MGVPREFLMGGMSYAGTNVSMRMLENAFIGYIGYHHTLAKWIMRQVSAYLEWPSATIRFKPFKMADDLQRMAFDLQLNQAGKLSDTTLLARGDYNQMEENQIMEKETASRMQATRAQQLAMTQLQAEQQTIMMKAQTKAQQQAAVDQQAPVAPGEPGGPEDMAAGTPGGQEAGQANAAAPLPGGDQSDPMGAMGSQLNAGQQMKPGQAGGVDLNTMAYMQAKSISSMPPDQQQLALQNLDSMSPELATMVRQQLKQMGVTAAPAAPVGGAPAVDARPLPDKLPPRRANASV
jgi:hypothetical protein